MYTIKDAQTIIFFIESINEVYQSRFFAINKTTGEREFFNGTYPSDSTHEKIKQLGSRLIAADLIVSSESLYDFIMKSEDREKRLFSSYNEENDNYEIWYKQINRPATFDGLVFDTEEEADDYIFNKIYEYDFLKDDQRDTRYYSTQEEAEEAIIAMMNEELRLDDEVIRSYRRKQLLVINTRLQNEKIQKEESAKKREARRQYINSEAPAEADSIVIDNKFKEDLAKAMEAAGSAKSNICASALKGLLERNGKEKIETDFWQVFRLLKSKVEIN